MTNQQIIHHLVTLTLPIRSDCLCCKLLACPVLFSSWCCLLLFLHLQGFTMQREKVKPASLTVEQLLYIIMEVKLRLGDLKPMHSFSCHTLYLNRHLSSQGCILVSPSIDVVYSETANSKCWERYQRENDWLHFHVWNHEFKSVVRKQKTKNFCHFAWNEKKIRNF